MTPEDMRWQEITEAVFELLANAPEQTLPRSAVVTTVGFRKNDVFHVVRALVDAGSLVLSRGPRQKAVLTLVAVR